MLIPSQVIPIAVRDRATVSGKRWLRSRDEFRVVDDLVGDKCITEKNYLDQLDIRLSTPQPHLFKVRAGAHR